MNLALVVTGADVPFGNDHTHVTHLKHDHGMHIISYPQDISHFYILICKLTCRIHSGRQAAKCRVTEYKCEGYTAHGTDSLSPEKTAFPMIISLLVRKRLIVGPDRSFLISILILQCSHGRIGFRRSRDSVITCGLSVCGCFRNLFRRFLRRLLLLLRWCLLVHRFIHTGIRFRRGILRALFRRFCRFFPKNLLLL